MLRELCPISLKSMEVTVQGCSIALEGKTTQHTTPEKDQLLTAKAPANRSVSGLERSRQARRFCIAQRPCARRAERFGLVRGPQSRRTTALDTASLPEPRSGPSGVRDRQQETNGRRA